jgi:hypothetical protein
MANKGQKFRMSEEEGAVHVEVIAMSELERDQGP